MSRARILVALVAAVALAAGAAYWLRHPTVAAPSAWQGYVEGNLVFMAPEEGGRIERLEAQAGDRVEAANSSSRSTRRCRARSATKLRRV